MSKVTVHSEGDHKNHTAANHKPGRWIRQMLMGEAGMGGAKRMEGKGGQRPCLQVLGGEGWGNEAGGGMRWKECVDETCARYKGIPSCPPPSDPADHRRGQQTLAGSQSLLISLPLAAGHLAGVTVCLILCVCHICRRNYGSSHSLRWDFVSKPQTDTKSVLRLIGPSF